LANQFQMLTSSLVTPSEQTHSPTPSTMQTLLRTPFFFFG